MLGGEMLGHLHGHAGQESEIKQQGIIEAAQTNKISAEAAEQAVLAEAKQSGAAAFQFDPNASAEEKAAQAKSYMPEHARPHREHKAATLATDQDDGTGPDYDLPSPTKDGVLPPASPGQIATAHQEKEDEWSKVGWAPRFGNPADKEQDQGTLLDHQTYLEGKIPENLFGDWYHNTAVIIFACLSSWVIAVLGGGLAWVFLVMAACGTYYRTSLRRVRRNFRDDVHRQMAKAKLETDHESLEWINSFLVKFWPIYAPVLCATIVNSVDQVLSTSTPAFLDSMRMKFFTLGTKPPRLEHVKTYPKAEDDMVLMDWKFSFTPNDTADLTAQQIKNKVNPKVVLEVRLGKAMLSKGLDIIVEDMAFSGLMRVKVKLQLPFPHIEKIEICFLERPTIDYVCKPLGGDMFGFDINFIPGLEHFIMEQIHANLGPIMYNPNVFPIEIAKLLAGNPVDQAIGVLQVTFHGAQGLKNTDKFSGTPDPYAVVSLNGRQPLGKTKTVHENSNPRWTETVNVILTSMKDNLTIQVFDWNEYRKDKELGQAVFALDQLEHESHHENLQLEIMSGGRARGIVQADIRFFPVLEGSKLPDGTLTPPPESNTGIAKFTVEQAKDLDGTKSLIGQLNPYAVLLLNGKEVSVSKKLKRTNNPIWPDATQELLITDRKSAKLGLVIKDDRDIATDPIIGTYQIKLDDMLELTAKGQEWYNLAGAKTGRTKMMLQWKPVALAGATGSGDGYVTPIGVMRLHFIGAKDLRNLETMGKSDPYVRVMLSGVQKRRTVTFQNNLNPEWDEVLYVPIHTTREKLTLEVMDEESLGKDRHMGLVELAVSDYVHQESNGEYEVHDTKKVISSDLHIAGRAGSRGTLVYTASFFPTIPIMDPEDEERDKASSENAARPALETTNGNGKIAEPGRIRSGTVGTISSLRTTSSDQNDLRKQLSKNEKMQEETALPRVEEVPKLRLTAEDLGNYESGILVFKIIDGDMAHIGCRLEVVMDDNVFPAYYSAKTKSRHFTFNETGDAMIRELDLSKITIRLVSKEDKRGDGENDHDIRAKVTGETLTVLRRSLYIPHQLILKDKEGHESKITVSLKFLPVKMKLDPSESFNNQGNLRVEVLDAADLPSADRNGFSDPFCKFHLSGKEVFKSKVQKKTLHPAWNEFFEIPVRSRTAANFEVQVWDWDLGDRSDFLGKAVINLDILEPFQRQEVVLGLDGKSGTIRLAMLFKPDYVIRSRQGSSTFSGTFSTPGKIVGAPVKGVGKGAVLVGGGVLKGASFVGRGFGLGKKHKKDGGEMLEDEMDGEQEVGSPSIAYGSAGPETPSQTRSRSLGGGTSPGMAESGTATISVVSASGFPVGSHVQVRVTNESTKKEVLKTRAVKTKTGEVTWDAETEKTSASADDQFRMAVVDHGTFNHKPLGDALFFVDDQGAGGGRSVAVGSGSVVIRSSFEPVNGGLLAPNAETASIVSGMNKDSPAGKSLRRSFMNRRDRSVTPGQTG
ncbi:hypothetical protein MBLNU457_7560t1 [Dothideomycetes sp. NU457]